VRVLGIDYGARRLGLALSDPTGTLASPWRQVARPTSERATLTLLVQLIEALRADDDGLGAIVVGWPRRLDGRPTDQTAKAEGLARAIEQRIPLPVVLQDERLTSHEADARLAARGERDWRRRKARLDAEAAAIILQDYLDHRP
jgi:putative Holliday junction resolvase